MSNLSVRRFILSQENEILRVANTKFQKIFDGDIPLELDWCKNNKIRQAELVVRLKDKKPVEVVRAVYSYIHFDENGYMNKDKFMKDELAAFEASDYCHIMRDDKKHEKNIINAEQDFAIRKRDNTLRWKPEMNLERKILDVAIDHYKCRRI